MYWLEAGSDCHFALAFCFSMIFSGLPSPAEASSIPKKHITRASRRRETGIHLSASCCSDDIAHDIDGAAEQRHRGFERAKRSARGDCHVTEARARGARIKRLSLEHVRAGIAD